jgi:hypothetical protein
MDEIRDAQKTDSISRFIDTHAVRTNPFGENRAGDRAYRRAERIAAAIHLLTNHLEGDEPVSSAIRSDAVELLQDMLELRSEMRSPRSSVFGAAQARIRHLISLVRILTVSGYISMQNASTMVEALDELGNFMNASQRSSLSESVAISRDDLMDVRGTAFKTARATVKDIKDRGFPSDNKNQNDGAILSVNGIQTKGQISVREQSILEALQQGGAMGIRDISAHLPEYSEKMIQRELSALVEGGKVRKSGEKRWSKYTIAQ